MTEAGEKTKTPGEIVRDNVRLFFETSGEKPNAENLMKRYKIGNSGAQAILRGDADPRLSTLAKIAKKEGCKLWELLHPAMTPRPGRISKEQVQEVELVKAKVDSMTTTQKLLLRQALMVEPFDPDKMAPEWDASGKNP